MCYQINTLMSSLLYLVRGVIWFICLIAETNRAPFDFSEGERELVSGFNTEYSRAFFVLLFLAEYGRIILLSFITSVLWFNGNFIVSFRIFSLILLIRSSFPRFRYDYLIDLVWKKILPVVIFILVFRISI